MNHSSSASNSTELIPPSISTDGKLSLESTLPIFSPTTSTTVIPELANIKPTISAAERVMKAAAATSLSNNTASPNASGNQSNYTALGHGRMLIVANRLPVSMSIKYTPAKIEGELPKSDINFTASAGGLVSALAGCDLESVWIGWPGGEVKSSTDKDTVRQKLTKLGCIPVFLAADVCDLFYNGFCNDLLWPLFHYIPLPLDSIRRHDEQFIAYTQAQMEFAKVVLSSYREGDVVWVHDYHLMLLPSLLRRAKPDMKIGFFFHTPFPSSEIYRVIPSRKELLVGVLASNLIGFHTHDYSRHFQSACTRIIGAICSNESVKLGGAVSTLGTYPIGIDPKRFLDQLNTQAVHKHLVDYENQFGGRKVLLGIDRLDYIKGITHKMYALERFFERYPNWIGKLVLVQIAVPSRTDVPEYQKLKRDAHELVSRINGKYGSISSVPIHYLDQSIPFDKMTALYRVADAMVITSVRDGMNLVAYEFIACQKDKEGVLILSEFAGAAQSLGAGALQINPWNITEVAEAIRTAIEMSPRDKKTRMEYCFNHVISHTAKTWAQSFVTDLNTALHQQTRLGFAESKPHMPVPLETEDVIEQFSKSRHRLIITGLAGLLQRAKNAISANSAWDPYAKSDIGWQVHSRYEEGAGEMWGWPADEADRDDFARFNTSRTPSPRTRIPVESEGMEEWIEMSNAEIEQNEEARITDESVQELKNAIRKISDDPHTTYFLLTSRSRSWCDALLGDTDVWMAAENGFFVKRGAKSPWRVMFENVDLSWRDSVYRVFQYFTERTPRSYIKIQDTSIAWHYHSCSDPVFAKRQAYDLVSHLTGGPLSNTSTEVLDSANIIQVRPTGVSKGRALNHLLTYLLKSRQRAEIPTYDDDFATPPVLDINDPMNVIPPSSDETNSITSGYEEDVESDGPPNNRIRNDLGISKLRVSAERKDGPPSTTTSPFVHGNPHNRRHSHGAIASNSNNDESILGLRAVNSLQSIASIATPSGASAFKGPLADFILCIGNFLERDEDVFHVLNQWSEHHIFPPTREPIRRLSVTLPRRLGVANSNTNSPFHSPLPSPARFDSQSSENLPLSGKSHNFTHQTGSSPSSPSLEPRSFANSGEFGSSQALSETSYSDNRIYNAPLIYTVTVGAKPSRARYYIPDTDSLSQLLISLSELADSPYPDDSAAMATPSSVTT